MTNCSTNTVQQEVVHRALYDDPLPVKAEADNSVELHV